MKKIIQIVYIAYKNIFRKKSRTMIIGSAVVISAFILLLTNAIASGVNYKIVKDQIHIDSGHLSIYWKDDYAFLPESRDYEKAAQSNLIRIIKKEPRVSRIFFNNTGKVRVNFSGIKEVEGVFMGIDFKLEESSLRESVQLLKGDFPAPQRNQVILSEKYAKQYSLDTGSQITVLTNTIYGAVNVMDFDVCGIYKNGTPWHEYYFYTDQESFNELFGGNHIFSKIKLFTEQMDEDIPQIKKKLQKIIRSENYPFIVKDYYDEIGMYKEFSETSRVMFNTLNFILIFIIILGIQSIVILAINDRMKEITTLRALGFYKSDIILLLLSEYIIIALFFGLIGVLISLAVIGIIQMVGIPLNSEVLKYLFGNNYLYPVISGTDFGITFFMIFMFVVWSVLPQAFKQRTIAGRNLN